MVFIPLKKSPGKAAVHKKSATVMPAKQAELTIATSFAPVSILLRW